MLSSRHSKKANKDVADATFKDIAIGHVYTSCANEVDTISMFQCHVKLLFYVYTSTGYIFKNLKILMNYVLVSYTTIATFRMTKYGQECMFDFYKWPASENDFPKLRTLVILFKEKK